MTELHPTILVIEDEPQMRRFLRALIGSHDYRLLEAESGREALALASSHDPDLIILDLGLPDTDGLDLVTELRGWTQTPIIVVSARGREQDKVLALDRGADDYLTKPFGSQELLARVRVALRHASRTANPEMGAVFRAGSLIVDLALRKIFVRDQPVHLTPLEYKLLKTLIEHSGKVLTHRQLLERVWGPAHADQTQYLRVYMAQLRRKIEQDPARPELLKTETGVGYRLEAPESS
jgi:two-component system, OmpR family, KDP operon response regulator KdpE